MPGKCLLVSPESNVGYIIGLFFKKKKLNKQEDMKASHRVRGQWNHHGFCIWHKKRRGGVMGKEENKERTKYYEFISGLIKSCVALGHLC